MKRVFKVLIVDSNKFFSAGLKDYIEDYFSQRKIAVFFMTVSHAYPMADLIFWAPSPAENPLPPGLLREKTYLQKLIAVMSHKHRSMNQDNLPCVFYRNQGTDVLKQLIDNVIGGEIISGCEKRESDDNLILTPRQEQVLYFMSRGLCVKEISSILNITGKTVSCHKRMAMTKLKLPRTTDLYQWLIGSAMARIAGKYQ